jgi:hypothetical protein
VAGRTKDQVLCRSGTIHVHFGWDHGTPYRFIDQYQGTTPGVTAGVGAVVPFFHGRLRPELRYSHWFPQPNPRNFNNDAPEFRIVKNEASFVLGLTF